MLRARRLYSESQSWSPSAGIRRLRVTLLCTRYAAARSFRINRYEARRNRLVVSRLPQCLAQIPRLHILQERIKRRPIGNGLGHVDWPACLLTRERDMVGGDNTATRHDDGALDRVL